MNDNLPHSLRPTEADLARSRELDEERAAIMHEIRQSSGQGVKVNTETYNAVTFGPDGLPVARVVNGVAQQSAAEEAVARAQAAANSEIMRMENELHRLIAERDEIRGYAPDGSPRYVLPDASRKNRDNRIRQLRLGLVNQKQNNERLWRELAAPAVRRAEAATSAAELARELEAQGKVQRVSRF